MYIAPLDIKGEPNNKKFVKAQTPVLTSMYLCI